MVNLEGREPYNVVLGDNHPDHADPRVVAARAKPVRIALATPRQAVIGSRFDEGRPKPCGRGEPISPRHGGRRAVRWGQPWEARRTGRKAQG